MTDRATLEALLARVLEGAGPDRELDGEIWRIAEPAAFTAPHGLDYKPWRYIGNGVWRDDSDPEGHNKAFVPPYTASLDAALTLVPDGWGWAISTTGDFVPCAYGHSPDRSFWVDDTKAATPARAGCALALRARISMAM